MIHRDLSVLQSGGPVRIPRPGVEFLIGRAQHRHRNPQQHDQRPRPRHGFQRAPDDQAPLAAGQILHHQQRHAAEAQPEAADESFEPPAQKVIPAESGPVKLLRQKRDHDRHDRQDKSGPQCAPPPLIDKCRGPEAAGQSFAERIVRHYCCAPDGLAGGVFASPVLPFVAGTVALAGPGACAGAPAAIPTCGLAVTAVDGIGHGPA